VEQDQSVETESSALAKERKSLKLFFEIEDLASFFAPLEMALEASVTIKGPLSIATSFPASNTLFPASSADGKTSRCATRGVRVRRSVTYMECFLLSTLFFSSLTPIPRSYFFRLPRLKPRAICTARYIT